jgi:hypothetical protein
MDSKAGRPGAPAAPAGPAHAIKPKLSNSDIAIRVDILVFFKIIFIISPSKFSRLIIEMN